jgi:hypothetical protein
METLAEMFGLKRGVRPAAQYAVNVLHVFDDDHEWKLYPPLPDHGTGLLKLLVYCGDNVLSLCLFLSLVLSFSLSLSLSFPLVS